MNRFFIFILITFLLMTAGAKLIGHLASPPPPPTTAQPEASPSATPTASPSATPRPLTFQEMNALYGPCVYMPTLMYHHVQPVEEAKAAGHEYLNVAPETFRSQMQYLRDKGYTVVTMNDLLNFFDAGTPPPKKSVLITFDDGYKDNYLHAFPILREFAYPATIFLSTGLMQNGDYLEWGQIGEMSGQRILMSNHTWSHKNLQTNQATIQKEIETADTQLTQRGLNTPKIFAYPYGLVSSGAKTALNSQGYTIAFTTVHGGTLCKKQRLELPRIRVGGGNLRNYGL